MRRGRLGDFPPHIGSGAGGDAGADQDLRLNGLIVAVNPVLRQHFSAQRAPPIPIFRAFRGPQTCSCERDNRGECPGGGRGLHCDVATR